MKPGVLFLLNSLSSGGAERQVISLLNHLDTQVFRLALAYLKPEVQLLPAVRRERLEAAVGLDVKRKLDLAAVASLAALIDRHAIDVLVSTNPYPTLYALLAARGSAQRPRQVEVFHSTTLHSAKEKLQMALYHLVFRRMDLLVYVSRLQREYWQRRGLRARRDILIHNGIDTDYFTDRFSNEQRLDVRARFGVAESDYLIGICAALRPEKAHGDFLLALARLRSSGHPAKGLIIGDGPERGAIEARIAQLDLVPHVHITGFQADVRPYLAACDVMSLTSHAVETFSLAALESMSMGKPMVMTRIGGAEEQVRHGTTGFLFAPRDIEALSGFLAELAVPQRRASMGAAAALSVRAQFAQEKMLNSFAAELTRLAQPVSA